MNTDRRHFLRNSAILTAGSALLPGWSTAQAATTTRTLSKALPLTSDDQTVLAWVASYAKSYRLQGGCVLGKLNGSASKFTQIVAYMSDPAKFAGLLAKASPLASALVNGDKYTFQYGATLFTLENSSTTLPTAANPDWMHAAIQYDPATHILTDPLGQVGTATTIDSTLKLVSKTRTVGQNLTALAAGLFDSALYKLGQNATFNTFRNSVLNTKVTTASNTAAVNTAFVQNLAALAQVFPANSLGTSIFQTPLLTTSIPGQFKMTAAQAVTRFTAVRAKVSHSYSDEAVWLAILLPAQTALQSSDLARALCLPANSGFNAILSLDALADMRQLLNDPAFPAA